MSGWQGGWVAGLVWRWQACSRRLGGGAGLCCVHPATAPRRLISTPAPCFSQHCHRYHPAPHFTPPHPAPHFTPTAPCTPCTPSQVRAEQDQDGGKRPAGLGVGPEGGEEGGAKVLAKKVEVGGPQVSWGWWLRRVGWADL